MQVSDHVPKSHSRDDTTADSPPIPPKNRTALILYGSETGNAQDVAEEVGRLTERLRFDCTVLDLDSVQLRDVLKHSVVIFVISTAGQGELPQNARKFWKTLLSGALKPGVLRKVLFSSFGLGDSSYPRYNVAHRMLHGRLVQLGANVFCDRGEGNEQHPEGHSAGFREWLVGLRTALLHHFPLPSDLQPIPDDAFLKPAWQLQTKTGSVSVATQPSGNGAIDAVSPSKDFLPLQDSYTANVIANDRVTALDHFQDVRLFDLTLERKYEYGPGAVAVIYPKNFPEDVQQFIQLMKWEEIADEALEVVRTDTRKTEKQTAASPLRHLDLTDTHVTLRWLLQNVLDIMSIPRRSFFASLINFAGENNDDEVYQKERLRELANPELIDELWDYTTRPKRTIVEVMMDFTTIKIPWQYALTALPVMRGRQFSIASGGRLRETEDGKTRVQLLVAIVDPPSPIIKWRRRYGVCTRYMATLQAGHKVNIGMQQGYLDVRPADIDAPAILIGPGTGVAPMRAMLHQRLHWAEEAGSSAAGKRLDGDMLFFGCRSENGDYFFRDEWASLSAAEGLQSLVAFSRDQNKPRQYVQDQIRENGALLSRNLLKLNGKIFVCGSSGNMPKGVREALVDVFVEHSKTMTREAAEEYLDWMEKAGCYKQETW